MNRLIDETSQFTFYPIENYLVIHGENHHYIWKLQDVKAGNGSDKLEILSEKCQSVRGPPAVSPCLHNQPIEQSKAVKRKRGRNKDSSTNKRPAKKARMSADDIAVRLVDMMQPYLQTWRNAGTLVAKSYEDIEAQLRNCKAKSLPMKGLRQALQKVVDQNGKTLDEQDLWSACFEHLCQCLDVCWLQTPTDEIRESPTQEQVSMRERVELIHRIVNAAVRRGVDESYALCLLSILAGSRNKFTHFLRAGGPCEVAAIDKFIELIRPQLRGGAWFLDPISFLAWCYNLESLHEPVEVFEDPGSVQIRTILGLDAFQRQGCAPSAKVQHCRRVTTDSTTPMAGDLSTLLMEQDTQCGETTESVSRDPVRNLQGSLDDESRRGATTHARLLSTESSRSSSDNVDASEMNRVGRVQLPSPISQTMSQAVFNGTAGNPGYGTTYNEGAPPDRVTPTSTDLNPHSTAQDPHTGGDRETVSPAPSTTHIGVSANENVSGNDQLAAETVSRTLFHDIDLERIGTAGQDLCDMIGGWDDADLEDWGHMLDENGNLFEHLLDAAERF